MATEARPARRKAAPERLRYEFEMEPALSRSLTFEQKKRHRSKEEESFVESSLERKKKTKKRKKKETEVFLMEDPTQYEKTKYRGVERSCVTGHYRVVITHLKKTVSFGTYATRAEALAQANEIANRLGTTNLPLPKPPLFAAKLPPDWEKLATTTTRK